MTAAAHLADPQLLRSLTTCLRRRVPTSDVEDVAQTVLCDALASDGAPEDPDELRKWVAGIARHKVADYHRRAKRIVLDDEACEAVAAQPHAAEARGLLADVAACATSDRDREALGWLVREHGGEHLSEIAREAGLSGAAVRQRVSRFRRVLRARFGAALTIALAIAAASAMSASRSRETIVAEATSSEQRASLAMARGAWRVASVQITGALSDAEKSVLEHELAEASVVVSDDHVELVTTSGRVERRALRGDGPFVFHGEKGTVAPVKASVVLSPDGLHAEVVASAGRAHVRLYVARR